MQEVVLTSGEDILKNAFFLLCETQMVVWNTKFSPGALPSPLPVSPSLPPGRHPPSSSQLPAPVGHPIRPELLSLGQALHGLDEVENELPVPFSVFCHGDYNLNNIIYDHKDQCLRYIDLYRSGYNDYVQEDERFHDLPLSAARPEPAPPSASASLAWPCIPGTLARTFANERQDAEF